jgi:hypothetical protein
MRGLLSVCPATCCGIIAVSVGDKVVCGSVCFAEGIVEASFVGPSRLPVRQSYGTFFHGIQAPGQQEFFPTAAVKPSGCRAAQDLAARAVDFGGTGEFFKVSEKIVR